MLKNYLTNEALKKHFKSNFELALYAINAARYYIRAGHEIDVTDLLKEIQKNPTLFNPETLAAMDKADAEYDDQE